MSAPLFLFAPMVLTPILQVQDAAEPLFSVADGWDPLTVLGSMAAGVLIGMWIMRRRLLRDGAASSGTLSVEQMKRQQEEWSFRLEELKKEQSNLENRRRVLSQTNEMLAMQKDELEEQARTLALSNQELERMEQLNAWQQEELSERNAALERQTTEAERLSSELEERVAELDRAMRQIDRMYREQESFLRHELGNAIVPIQGYSEMLLAAGGIDDKVRDRVRMIRQASERMAALLEVLRNLQAIERGDRAVVRAHIDLDALVIDAIRTADPEGSQPVGVQTVPIVVRGDPALLPGVFLNLVRNAVEHVRAGSDARSPDGARQELDDSVPGRSDQPEVSVSMVREGSYAVVRVANGGDPIPPERLASFFERFNSTKPGGTGLGTSYARLVVEAHGGDISVTSAADTGTVVTVRLPVKVQGTFT